MGELALEKYLSDLADLRRASRTQRESIVPEGFKTCLKDRGGSDAG